MSKLLILAFCVITCRAFKLPPYITKCKFNDKSMAQCILDNVPRVRPYLKDGIKELHVPKLSPFHLEELVIEASKNLVIKMSDLDVHDLDIFEMKDVKINEIDFLGSMNIYFEKIQILGTYDIDGQILILPIKGHGPANITLNKFQTHHEYNFRPVDRNGTKYLNLKNVGLEFRAGRIYLQLENLFNGDQVLGDQVNAFLNENWKDVENLLKPAITKTVMNIIDVIFGAITSNIPLDELFSV